MSAMRAESRCGDWIVAAVSARRGIIRGRSLERKRDFVRAGELRDFARKARVACAYMRRVSTGPLPPEPPRNQRRTAAVRGSA